PRRSSLAFGTVAAKSQRLINETYRAFVEGFMPALARAEVDVLDGLTTASTRTRVTGSRRPWTRSGARPTISCWAE
ncbi:MAG TPA: hypothetical protein VGK42_03940, partial [Candidatus Dormibacteraeota bacterium]